MNKLLILLSLLILLTSCITTFNITTNNKPTNPFLEDHIQLLNNKTNKPIYKPSLIINTYISGI